MNLANRSWQRAPGPDEALAIDVSAASLASLEALKERYGNVVEFPAPQGRRAMFINEPAAVRRMLVRHHGKYRKGRGFERVEMLLGNGLIVSDGDVWRRSRTMIQPAFSRRNVQRLIPLMIDCARRRSAAWAPAASRREPLNVTQEMSDFALELILRAIFGPDYERFIVAGGNNPFAFLSEDSTRDLSVVLKLRRLRELLLDIIAHRRGSPDADGYDFLSVYLTATDREGQPYSDRQLLDELMTLIVAGYETSASTLSWCWLMLAGHPEAAERVREEAAAYGPDFAAAGDDPGLSGMPWTQQVLDETLRLYPPVWLFSRRALEDDELEGFVIPENTDVYLSPYIMHRSAENWERPDEFLPERFAGDGPQQKGEHPYFPFSLGPRRCLGEYFSFLEMKILLGMLVQRYRLRTATEEHPGLDLGINLRSQADIYLIPETR